ncbi:MAG: 4'-phosphopantetheinyl transferase superfamily protein [Flavobacteriaceae bacterium]|nr:4'-phosphopantetheinyl transferase superfamily protein [Flavobacteriaceae bacterium]
MPVIDRIQLNFTEIITWHVTETKEEMLEVLNLSDERLEKMQKMPEKQAMEYLGLRACLLELNADLDVHYDQKGKPFLKSEHHISITHSYGFVSVGLSYYKIGIDIEKRRDSKILNISKKFTNLDEQAWIPENEQYADYLHIVWGIKEGLYKINGGNLWNFKHHYRVEPFELIENSRMICWISDELSSRKYFAYYKMVNACFLVWVLDYEV